MGPHCVWLVVVGGRVDFEDETPVKDPIYHVIIL